MTTATEPEQARAHSLVPAADFPLVIQLRDAAGAGIWRAEVPEPVEILVPYRDDLTMTVTSASGEDLHDQPSFADDVAPRPFLWLLESM